MKIKKRYEFISNKNIPKLNKMKMFLSIGVIALAGCSESEEKSKSMQHATEPPPETATTQNAPPEITSISRSADDSIITLNAEVRDDNTSPSNLDYLWTFDPNTESDSVEGLNVFADATTNPTVLTIPNEGGTVFLTVTDQSGLATMTTIHIDKIEITEGTDIPEMPVDTDVPDVFAMTYDQAEYDQSTYF
jgi:hypothetical protein